MSARKSNPIAVALFVAFSAAGLYFVATDDSAPAIAETPPEIVEATSSESLPGSLEAFKSKIDDVPGNGVFETVRADGSRVIVVVSDDWHYEPRQVRLQIAQSLQKIWAQCRNPGRPDSCRLKLEDLSGNAVGGSRAIAGSLIWVAD